MRVVPRIACPASGNVARLDTLALKIETARVEGDVAHVRVSCSYACLETHG